MTQACKEVSPYTWRRLDLEWVQLSLSLSLSLLMKLMWTLGSTSVCLNTPLISLTNNYYIIIIQYKAVLQSWDVSISWVSISLTWATIVRVSPALKVNSPLSWSPAKSYKPRACTACNRNQRHYQDRLADLHVLIYMHVAFYYSHILIKASHSTSYTMTC